MAIIYAITNSINGKQYVGQTLYSIEKRFTEHLSAAKCSDRPYPLYRAIRKYGPENFSIQVLEEVADESIIDDREIYWISKLNTYHNGYNATLGGKCGKRTIMDKSKVLELYHDGYNTTEIAQIIGHERSGVSRLLKSCGLSSNFQVKTVQISAKKGDEVHEFDSARDAAKFFISNGICRSSNAKTVSALIIEAKKQNKPYFGWIIT